MSISLKYTSFTSQTLAIKLLAAAQEVKATGDVVRVKNRRGQDFLLVTIVKDALGYTLKFLDNAGRDQSVNILTATSAWPESIEKAFWALLSSIYSLTEHPLVSKARASTIPSVMKARGATHIVELWGGATMYAIVKRDWLGRKQTYIVGDSRGRWYDRPAKVTKEARETIHSMEKL